MLINFTNHPSSLWSPSQTEAARKEFGDIVDVTFPIISPDADEEEIGRMADEYVQKIKETAGDKTFAVHLMGEMTFTFAMLKRLMDMNIACVASTTERMVVELDDGKKIAQFKFVKFRRYE
jgi:hypothetical protein